MVNEDHGTQMRNHLFLIITLFVTGCTATKQNNLSFLTNPDTLKFPSKEIVSEINYGIKWKIPEGSFKMRMETEEWTPLLGGSDYSLKDSKVEIVASNREIEDNMYREDLYAANGLNIRITSNLQSRMTEVQLFLKGEKIEAQQLFSNDEEKYSMFEQFIDAFSADKEKQIKRMFANLGKTFKSGDEIPILFEPTDLFDNKLKELKTLDDNFKGKFDKPRSFIKGYGTFDDRNVIVADINYEGIFSYKDYDFVWFYWGGYQLIDPLNFLPLKGEFAGYLLYDPKAKIIEPNDRKVVFKFEVFDINISDVIM